jgi:hypothetical protein
MLSTVYIRLIAVAVVIAAVLGGIWYVHHLRAEVTDLMAKNVVLTNQVKTQNDAIDTFKADSDKRLAAASVQLAAASAAAGKIQQHSVVVYKTVPSKGTSDCASDRQSTLDLMNGAAK